MAAAAPLLGIDAIADTVQAGSVEAIDALHDQGLPCMGVDTKNGG